MRTFLTFRQNQEWKPKPFILCAGMLLILCGGSAYSQVQVPHTTIFVLPKSYLAVASGATDSNSWMTMLDQPGGTEIAAQPLTVGVPLGFVLDPTGTFGEAVQSSSFSFNDFPVGTGLTPGTVLTNGLPDGSCVSNMFAPANQLYTLDYKNNAVNIGFPLNSQGSFAISEGDRVDMTPVAMTTPNAQGRSIIVSQNIPYGVACNNIPRDVQSNGTAAVFASSAGTTDGEALQLGKCPVYALTSADGRRSFVLNRGGDSITVINMDQAEVDRTIQLPSGSGPVYGEFVARTNKLVVANYDNDTVSVINAQLDQYGADAPAFGTIINNVDLWNGALHTTRKHPAGLTVLPDGTEAYVANQEEGTVSTIDLALNQALVVTPGFSDGAPIDYTMGPVPVPIPNGSHPRDMISTSYASTNSLFTTIYIATPDSSAIPTLSPEDFFVSVPSCPNQLANCANGHVTDIHVSSQITSIPLNTSVSTRLPGAGEPCMTSLSPANLSACQAH